MHPSSSTHRNEDGLAFSVHSQVPRINGWSSESDERGHKAILDLADGVVATAERSVKVLMK